MGSPLVDDHGCGAAPVDDRAAFTTLYQRYARAVWNHAYRLTLSANAAEDVAAATFLTAWRRRDEVELTEATALPWLLAVAANEARTEWRGTARQRRVADRIGPPPAVGDHSDAVTRSVDARRRAQEVIAAIQQLPPTQREAVTLCWVGGVSQTDAARALGITQVTLRLRIHRARTRMRAVIPQEGL